MSYVQIRLTVDSCYNCPHIDTHPQDPDICGFMSKEIKEADSSIYDFIVPEQDLPDWCPFLYNHTPSKVDEKFEAELDKHLHKDVKTIKMLRIDEVTNAIRECVDRPKGVVPDSVYELIPDIKF